MNHTATYSPEDNKLRLYPAARLDTETYTRVKAAGFIWAPKQGLFVAPAWTPSREDLLLELCGEVGDEDTSLVERAEERAERFEDYSEARAKDAEQARSVVSAIADNIPFGQPILVGHHSEKHARKDAERIENGMRKAVRMWETSKYWQSRAAGAIRHAKYKELPAVRARRIKGIEADKRKEQKDRDYAVKCLKFWNGELQVTSKESGHTIALPVDRKAALWFCNNYDHISMCFPLDKFPRSEPASQYEGSICLWSALGGSDGPETAIITVGQARELATGIHTRFIARADRWLNHYNNRLEYECAMLAASGGTVADRTKPEKGGACKCWASHRGGWSYIAKVNKVSVTVYDNWGNGGENFTRTIPFDSLGGILSAAEVQAARDAGKLQEYVDKTGFALLESPSDPQTTKEKPAQPEAQSTEKDGAAFDAMRETLRAGVQVVAAPQLFPTPCDLAARMVELARIEPGNDVLEPSAGTGRILDALINDEGTDWSGASVSRLVAVEVNHKLAHLLSTTYAVAEVKHADFLECNGDLGKFDRVLMNPPFANAEDIRHIEHALHMLKPGGRIVAICANGPRQNERLKPLAKTWEPLPGDTFKESGTGVNAVLLTIEG